MDRGYLLPPGCKDLIDVLNLKTVSPWSQDAAYLANLLKFKAKMSPQEFEEWVAALKKLRPQFMKFPSKPPFGQKTAALPPVVGEIVVSAETTAAQLAVLLGRQPFQIVADVMELGLFVGAEDPLSFEIISSVARKHGFFAIRAVS